MSEWRYHTQLLHHETKKVMLRPSFNNLSAVESVNHDTRHLDLFSSRLDPFELTGLGTGPAHTHHDPVSLGNQIVDDMCAVRVGARKHLERLFDAFESRLEIGDRRRIVIDKIVGEKLIQSSEILLVRLFVEATHQTLVVFDRHRSEEHTSELQSP